jgi:asparagine synthase (glutamine-hydrolysing)
MCGIFGILSQAPARSSPALVEAAHSVQGHRGPDGRGTQSFAFDRSSLLLAHQRLAIIDLTPAGHQPMAHRDGLGSIVYNGELYNYLELRDELRQEGETFATQTDTEVLLSALHRWGAARALSKLNWMGAFAWLDLRNHCLTLARDAESQKPLYYFSGPRQFIFASEIKTLLTLAGRKFQLERDVVGRFIHQGLSDTSTRTIFKEIAQLAASSYVRLDLAAVPPDVRPIHYSPPGYTGNPASLSLADCIEEVRRLFFDSVRLRLRSDVPVGVLLSGGIDSSSIAAVAHELRGDLGAPQLLSAINDDARFDESRHISAMERHLRQTAHKIDMRISERTLVEDLSRINWINDEPVAGLSALGHYRLMEEARQFGVKVIMSGQGADEIFLGYRKYLGFYLQSLLKRGRCLMAMGVLARFVANRTVVNQFDLGEAKRYLPMLGNFSTPRFSEPETHIDGTWLRGWNPAFVGLGRRSLAERQKADIRELSVPALCHYEDRMSMALGREIRLPFLDSRLVDLMLGVPDEYKLRKGWTKYCLREAMRAFLPPQIAWRKDKMGFANPQGEWLKAELKPAVTDAFSAGSLLSRKGIIDSGALQRKYRRYCGQASGSGSIWYREIFAPFSLEMWMQQYAAWID